VSKRAAQCAQAVGLADDERVENDRESEWFSKSLPSLFAVTLPRYAN
jgi:hypothetical protein